VIGIIEAARAAGLTLSPFGDQLRVEPAPPAQLLPLLREHKVELIEHLKAERRMRVSAIFAGAFDRLNSSGRAWAPEDIVAVHDLGDAADRAALGYIAGTGALADFETSIDRWVAQLLAAVEHSQLDLLEGTGRSVKNPLSPLAPTDAIVKGRAA
jgi:hypothetical protein